MSISSTAPWLHYYGNTPSTIDYPKLSMYQIVAQTAKKNPQNCAYDFMGKQTTYGEFLKRISLVAKSLLELGIKKGDHVTICMPNSPQAVDCFYAINRIGAVSNMIHPLSASGEILFYLNFCKSKAILTLDQFYPKIAEIESQLNNPIQVIVASIATELPFVTALGFRATKGRKIPKLPPKGNYILWNNFLAKGKRRKDPLPKDKVTASQGASILYSGGTTGTTKGILLSSLNFNALALQTLAASGFASMEGVKMLAIMPIFHGFGLGIGIHTAFVGGATCILVPQFTVDSYAKLLITKKPNIISGVPTLFEALLRTDKMENADLSFLKGMFCGGDTLSVELKKKVDTFLKEHNASIQIREGYGTTECVTASCLTPIDYARPGSIGVPFPDTFYKIVKPATCEELPPNIDGEICISGPTVMMGYVDNPEETANALRRHDEGRLWLHTGDLGHMDLDGFVYFRQRIKRMIITSGYNVFPSQLENIIDAHEKVLLSCVIGIKDPYKMQKIKAFVVLKSGVEPSEAVKTEILAYCAKHIAKYALPYAIEFRVELPKTLVGKVAYRVLEEEEASKVVEDEG